MVALRPEGQLFEESTSAPSRTPALEGDPLLLVLAATHTGVWRWDAASGQVWWDTTMEALCGLEPGTFGSTFEAWRDTLHPDERVEIFALVEEAIERRGSYEFSHRAIWPDGSEHWLECRGQVTTDDDGGFTGTVGCAIDVTDRKATEQDREDLLNRSQIMADRLDRLQRLSGHLTAATTVGEVGNVVLDLLVTPNTSDARGLWLLDEGDVLRLVAYGPPSAGATIGAFAAISVDSDLPAAQAFRTRSTVTFASAQEARDRYPALEAVERSADGFIAVPLCVNDVCFGVVSVGFDGHLEPEDVRFIQTAAAHVAQTVARVRLSEAVERRAGEATLAAARERRERERLEFLANLTQTALAATDHRDLMRRVTAAAVPELGDWCSLHFRPEPDAPPEVAVAHSDPARVAWATSMTERYPYDPDATTGAASVMRTGRTEFIEEFTPEVNAQAISASGIDPAEAQAILDELRLTSMITVPLITKRGTVGAMAFVSAESGRRYDRTDVALAEAAAGRIAEAIDNMWLTDEHRRTSALIQQALLPPAVPAIPGIDVAVRYWPAGVAAEVGGDFYDVFALDPSTWAILIGDVCGTGPNAAALSSIARHTVRAAARNGLDHVEIVDWLNTAVLHSDRGLFCTSCFATLRAVDGSWQLRTTLSGHPLPILVSNSAGVRSIGSPGTLLGAFDDVKAVPFDCALAVGDVVVFYTDGVTDLPPPFGMEPDALADQVEALTPGRTAGEIADAIYASIGERVPDTQRLDDVAVVVLRVTAEL